MSRMLIVLGLGGVVLLFAQVPSSGGGISSTYQGYQNTNLNPSSSAGNINDEYLEKLYEENIPNSRYLETLWKANNSVGAQGYLNNWYDPSNNNKKKPEDYKKEVSNIQKTIEKGRLKAGEMANGDDAENLTSILASLLAGRSYGYIFRPTTQHLGNYKREYWTAYSFVVGQQKIRDGVLREHAERIAELKKELSYLYEKVKDYCGSDYNHNSFSINSMGSFWFNANGSCGRYPLFYSANGQMDFQPVVQAIERQTQELVNMHNESKKLQCLNYLAQLHYTKVAIEMAELQLLSLSTQYNQIQNEERRMLERLR